MTETVFRNSGLTPEGLTPPQALEAERSVLAAMLLDHESVGMAIELIDGTVFYRTAHQKIFEAIAALFSRNEKADLVTLTEELRKRGELEAIGGTATLTQILEYATTASNLEQYIRIVHSKSILRQLIKATGEIQQEAYAGSDDTTSILDRAEERVFAISDQRVRQGFVAIRELLKPAFEHIQHLFDRKVLITGVPSGFSDLDALTAGFQAGDLVVLGGRPSMGKCLTSTSLIDDPETGERRTIEECVRRKLPTVMGVSDSGSVRAAAVGDWIDSGIQPCYRVRTRTGRRVEVTGHHPFLTVWGWLPLSDLEVGSKIAVPRELPVFGSDDGWSLERVRFLAYFIAEGGLTGGTPHFTNTDPVILDDFRSTQEQDFPECVMNPCEDGITYRVAQKNHRRPGRQGVSPNPITEWLDELGLMGKLSRDKFVPEAAWRFTRDRLAEFIRALFSCDATIYPMAGYPRIEFTVASSRLAGDIHHALCRFGIVSKLWQKSEASWRVEITEPASVELYQRDIGWIGEKASRFPARELATVGAGSRRSNSGHVEPDAWNLVRIGAAARGLTLTEVARRAGEPVGDGFNPHARRGIPQHRLAGYARVLDHPILGRAANPDLYWDAIVSIESVGEQQVYDLCVPDGANFIANDICVHNTSLALNMAENAAVNHRVPVAVFSLEMSKEQLVQRLLCSQGGVALHRVRNGSLSNEDWPRLTTAAGLLTQAPIMIDDSPSLTLMEIRAKCRRLKAESKLGMLVIDYLQLIRPSGSAENRVQEISQITRGLKALAKELSVPIMALSQLSRAVETRDKSGRPQLSDLRESGSVEQDADVVMFVYREEVYKPDTAEKGKALVILAKQRNGPTADVPLTFLRESTKFVPYTPIMAGETDEAF